MSKNHSITRRLDSTIRPRVSQCPATHLTRATINMQGLTPLKIWQTPYWTGESRYFVSLAWMRGRKLMCFLYLQYFCTSALIHLDIFDKKVLQICSVGKSGSNLEYFEILLSSLRQLAPHSEVEWVKKMGVNVWRLWCLTKPARNLFKDDHLNLLEEEIQKQPGHH